MSDRRGLLRDLGLIAIGGVGMFAVFETDALDKAQSAVPATSPGSGDDSGTSGGSSQSVEGRDGDLLKEVTVERPEAHGIRWIRFFSSGEVSIKLITNHDPGRIAFTHGINTIHEEVYDYWDAPMHSGPLNVNLKAAIRQHGPYTSRRFRFVLVKPENNTKATIGGAVTFRVPESYMPE